MVRIEVVGGKEGDGGGKGRDGGEELSRAVKMERWQPYVTLLKMTQRN
jgi:hypothetical protein